MKQILLKFGKRVTDSSQAVIGDRLFIAMSDRQKAYKIYLYITPCIKYGFAHAGVRIFTTRDIKFRTILVRKTFS